MSYDISGLKNRNALKENPFLGTDYEDLWNNNPYKSLYYEPTFWDNIGLSNKAKDANLEYDRLYAEYIAGLYDQQRQDEYNSPSAEVERMREAGLNPDLQGLSGASNTDEMNAPNSGPNPALNGQSPFMNAFNTITQVLGFATSTLQQIQGIRSLSLGNEASELSNYEKFLGIAEPHIINEYANRFSGGHSNNWSDVMKVSSIPFSRRTSKKYEDAFASLLSSSKFTASESAWNNMTANDRAMKTFINGMVDYSIQAQKYGYTSQASKGKFETQYYDGLDADIASSATNRENSNKGWLDKWRNEFYSNLYKEFKDGSQLAGLILIGLGPSLIQGVSSLGSSVLSPLTKLFGKLKK